MNHHKNILLRLSIITLGFAFGHSVAMGRSFDQASLGKTSGTLAQQKMSLATASLSSYWRITPWFYLAPGFQASYSDTKTPLFDSFRSATLMLNAQASYNLGRFEPYSRLGLIGASYVLMSGNLNATNQNNNQSHELAYSLKGQIKGYEATLGTMFHMTENLSMLAEASLVRQNLTITGTTLSPGFYTNDHPITGEHRGGLGLTRKSASDPLDLETTDGQLLWHATTLSLGIIYHI